MARRVMMAGTPGLIMATMLLLLERRAGDKPRKAERGTRPRLQHRTGRSTQMTERSEPATEGRDIGSLCGACAELVLAPKTPLRSSPLLAKLAPRTGGRTGDRSCRTLSSTTLASWLGCAPEAWLGDSEYGLEGWLGVGLEPRLGNVHKSILGASFRAATGVVLSSCPKHFVTDSPDILRRQNSHKSIINAHSHQMEM